MYIGEGGIWGEAEPFKNVVRYNTSEGGHQPGEPMRFRIWPVPDPDYLELRFTGGNNGTFSWASDEEAKSIINEGSILYTPGGFTYPPYSNFYIYSPVSSSIAQTLELGVFLGGESEEFINLGTLHLTHDHYLSKKYTCT